VDARYGHDPSYLNRDVDGHASPRDAIAVAFGPNHYWFHAGISQRSRAVHPGT
jgi:hypothetical protein